jgi:class 3 adenylate cyclase/tetratricopeptide (TPR) repeat protein
MRCSNCGKDNPQGLHFCNQCGSALKPRCAKCGFENEPGARFCGNCGISLNTAALAGAAVEGPEAAGGTEARPPAQFGERRHLTVLFCDLIGSTELAAQLDPEEWHATIAAYHRSVAETVSRFGGRVAKFLGDGVMAYFGYPEAHDNDAERAARAGLAMLEAISKLHQETGTEFEQSTRPRLSARVGIDSGRVVVSTDTATGVDIFGEAPNIAARVQVAAAPDTVLITASTYRLVTGLFVLEDCGSRTFKGIEQPIQLYRVIQPERARGRLAAAAASRGLTPFVGREDELGMLTKRWQRVTEGEGQVVLIVGEAGIGKSRLVQQFRQDLAGAAHTWIEAAAAPFYQNTPFFPIAEALWQLVWEQSLNRFGDYLRKLQTKESGEEGGDAPATDERFDDLQSGLISAGLTPAEAIPLIAPLMHLPLSEKYAPSALTPEQQRRRLLATLVEWLLGATRSQPLVIVIEDLHWADPSTRELIQLLADQGANAQLLLLYTARPEFRPEWPLRAHHTQIALNRLNTRDVRAMIAQVAAQNALANQTLDAVVERTSGVPLFVEELTRAVLESGNTGLTEREIPVTLHDSLMARLDRLGSAKEVLQIASVIGSEFSYELLQAVHPLDHQNLQRELRRLTDSDLLHVRGLAPDAKYQFKHALIRDAAYEALLKSRRKELHRDIARTIDEKFPDIKDTHPEVLAHHWSEAGELDPAIAEWSRAAKLAESRSAFIEAQESLQQVLTLLHLLPESRERDLRELELRQSLVSILHMTRGWAAPEAAEAAVRIGLLAERTGDLRQLIESMSLRCFQALIAGDLSTAAALADETLELARQEGNPTSLALLHSHQVLVRFYRGDLAGAERYFTSGLKFFDDPGFRQLHSGSAIAAFGWASWTAWMLGRADVARERLAKMRLAVRPANPHDLPWSDAREADLHILMRENESAEASAARALELCEKHLFPSDAATSRCALGHARAELGRAAEGIALMRQGIDTWVQIGQRISVDRYIMWLAAAQLRAGEIGAAFETIEQALNFNPDEHVYRPEALRIRGEVRLKQGDLQLAEADFRDSISMARSMGAKAWELRTIMSLARLLSERGRRNEAHNMLAEIYNWFTEGLDTADLKDAKALLDELSR